MSVFLPGAVSIHPHDARIREQILYFLFELLGPHPVIHEMPGAALRTDVVEMVCIAA